MSLKINSLLLSTTLQTIYQVPPAIEASVHGLVFSNNTSNPVTFDLIYYKNSTNLSFYLAKEFEIPPRESYIWSRPINMESGDYLESLVDTNNAVTVMASYYEKDTKIAKGFTVRGDWDENATYDVNDIVAFEGQLFVALEGNTGIDPEESNSGWLLFIPEGLPGEPGIGIPEGGLTGNILAKQTNDDFDTEWIDFNASINSVIDASDKISSDISGIAGAIQVNNIISLTQQQYDAIGIKDPQTIYIITDE